MTTKDPKNNTNNKNSNDKVKWIIKWKIGNLCREKNSRGTKNKTEDSFDKVVYKAPLKRNCCDVCKLF